jgi:hypothetical protein
LELEDGRDRAEVRAKGLADQVEAGGQTWAATVDGITGRSWTGPTEQSAIKAAKDGSEALYREKAETSTPAWMEAERAISERMKKEAEEAYVGVRLEEGEQTNGE